MPFTHGPLPPRDMKPSGWGEQGRRMALPPHARRWLVREIGIDERPTAPASLGSFVIGASELAADVLDQFGEVVGQEHVLVDDESRIRHAGGKSYLDLVRARRGVLDAPDAVILPPDHNAVLAVLRLCVEHDIAVVPFGGGTGVVGGLTPLRGSHSAVISLDMRRVKELVRVDPESLTVTVGAGLRGPEIERLLAPHSLTIGHFPQSWEHASLGGYAATRSAGQASSGYGRFDDLVVALRVATPEGTLQLGRAPASAAGPDLRALILGSEGVFGVITEMTLRARHLPELVHDEGWSFRSFEAGLDALRRLAQAALAPEIARLSDADESTGEPCARQRGKDAATQRSPGSSWPPGRLLADRRLGGCAWRRARPAHRRSVDPASRRWPASGYGGRRDVATPPLPRPVPSRRAARPRSDGGDASRPQPPGRTSPACTTQFDRRSTPSSAAVAPARW